MKNLVLFWVAFLIVLCGDQVSKHWAMTTGSATLNPGLAFGLFAQNGQVGWLMPLVLMMLAGLWLYRYWSSHPVLTGLFFGAAVSNLVDRWRWQAVVDWLPVPFVGLYNNLADWILVICLGLLCMHFLRRERSADAT